MAVPFWTVDLQTLFSYTQQLVYCDLTLLPLVNLSYINLLQCIACSCSPHNVLVLENVEHGGGKREQEQADTRILYITNEWMQHIKLIILVHACTSTYHLQGV